MNEWTWSYEGGSSSTSSAFPTQADAEAWFAENWQDLAADGVTAVTLRQAEHDVYGPMSLTDG